MYRLINPVEGASFNFDLPGGSNLLLRGRKVFIDASEKQKQKKTRQLLGSEMFSSS